MHPLVLLGALLVKKAAALTLYQYGSRYGWPRVYRRILEANRRLTPPAQQPFVRAAIKAAFIVPAKTGEVIANTEVYRLAMRALEEQQQAHAIGPRTAAALQRVLANGVAVAKDFGDLAARSLPRRGGGGPRNGGSNSGGSNAGSSDGPLR
jgi:hypothetical protein